MKPKKTTKAYLIFWGRGWNDYAHITPVVDNILIDATFLSLSFHKIKDIKDLDYFKKKRKKLRVTAILEVQRKRVVFNKVFLYNCIGMSKLITGERGLYLSPYTFYRAIKPRSVTLWD